MAYATKYIVNFTNALNEDYEILFDYLNYIGGTPIPLTITDDGLVLRSTAGDEDRLYPILGTECLIKVFVDENTNVGISDLIAEFDLQIRVTVNRIDPSNGNLYMCFQGFVVVEDNSQPFEDRPYILSFRALDGLGLLKTIPFTDTTGVPFNVNLSVVQWLAQLLYRTGQTLNFRTYFNFFHASFAQGSDPLVQTYLNSIAFETGQINLTDVNPADAISRLGTNDCYTALEKIVRCFRCRLFMENGVWHLVNLYDQMNPSGYSYTEYTFGDIASGIVQVSPVARVVNKTYNTTIGKNEMIFPVLNDQQLYLKLSTRWIELTYAYNQALNKIINQDLLDIDISTPNPAYAKVIVSNVIDETGSTFHGRLPDGSPIFFNMNTIGFEPYGWTHENGNYVTPTPPDKFAFIRIVQDFLGYEFERFMVLETSGTSDTFLKSTFFRLDVGDTMTVSVDFRTLANVSSAILDCMAVLLFGDDGSHYSLSADENNPSSVTKWVPSGDGFAGGYNTVKFDYTAASSPKTFYWNTINASASFNGIPNQAPVSGTVQILFVSLISSATNEFWYKNLQITIFPFLSGSFSQLKGDYNYSSTNNNILQTESDNIEISDSPKTYFQGALIQLSGDLLTPEWSRFGVTESLRFTQIMERIMYNLLSRMVYKIEGTFKGVIALDNIDLTILDQAGFINSYYFIDGDFPTKRFILTSFENDIGSGQGRRVYVEVLQDANDTGFAAPDNYIFSYLF